MRRDIFEKLKVIKGLSPITVSATGQVTGIDVSGYESIMVVAAIGVDTALDGSNYWTLDLKECATTGGSYTAVADKDAKAAIGTITAGVWGLVNSTSEDDTVMSVSYFGNKDFLQVNYTETGTLSGPLGIIVLGVPKGSTQLPITNT